MTAERPDDYPYEAARPVTDPAVLRRYWGIAKGLQAVDGLETSMYFDRISKANIDGELSMEEAGVYLHRRYFGSKGEGEVPEIAFAEEADGEAFEEPSEEMKEADLVALRIAEMLAGGAFLFAPEMLSNIHRYIFQDLNPDVYKPGVYKSDLLLKREAILNGDSVLYADPSLIEASLRIAFEDETRSVYGERLGGKALENLAKFVARIWQVHPFNEGNTRSVAVFAVLYLNDLGYDVTNEPFELHSKYFRDALVRANYRNPKARAFPDRSFLAGFLDDVLNGKRTDYDRDALRVTALFDDPTLIRNIVS